MCGICGVLDYYGKGVDEKLLIEMRDSMKHRGPDDFGIYFSDDKTLGLAHRRLAIIDLSTKAKQPMSNEEKNVWIVFNGEIYNYKELRDNLKEKHVFTSNSDTEVIVHLYEEKGIKLINDLRGMFSFALWDGKKRKLFLVRDRVGVKPLYYTQFDKKIFFASEIKALLVNPDIPRQVDEKSLYHYLSFLTTPPPNTLFKGIKKLAGGSLLEINEAGDIKEKKYWDVLDHTKSFTDLEENEMSEKILDELRLSVQYRKISDVPVGVFLSGGIDSSTNARLFSEGETKTVKTFSIGYEGNQSNEFVYARKMAKLVNSDHHEKKLNVKDLMDFISEMVFFQDEPIADPVCVPIYYVSKLARENDVVVCQVGEGSDELFWGYPSWKTVHKLEKLNNLPASKFFERILSKIYEVTGRDEGMPYELLRRALDDEPIFWGGIEAFTEKEKKQLLSPRLREKFIDYSSFEVIKSYKKRFDEKAVEKTPVNWMSYLDLNLRLPELLLMRVDKMSMAVSLEARVPFLDHKFVELAMSIPEEVKTKNNELKYILKKSVSGLIPDELIYRKKQGFSVPLHEWFNRELGDYSKEKILDFSKTTDFFDQSYIKKLLKSNNSEKIWYILNFVLWYERWIEE